MIRSSQSFFPPLAAAATLHAGLLGWLAAREPPREPPRRPPTVVRLATRPPPPPMAPPRVVEEPRPARRVLARARPVEPPPVPVQAPAPVPPRAPDAALPSAAAAPPRFAVSMDATASGGSVAVPPTEGATAPRGDPRLPSAAPVGDAAAGPVADVLEVERLPRLAAQPSAAELRAMYPPTARREGLEADVRLELLVTDRGDVERVRLMQGAGRGFDEAARELARRMRFEPARRGSRTVAVWIPWTWKFRLDG